jgi:hypothetical protein
MMQAAAHVAGLIAYLIALDGNISPSAMKTKLQTLAVKNILSGVRESPTPIDPMLPLSFRHY